MRARDEVRAQIGAVDQAPSEAPRAPSRHPRVIPPRGRHPRNLDDPQELVALLRHPTARVTLVDVGPGAEWERAWSEVVIVERGVVGLFTLQTRTRHTEYGVCEGGFG